MSRLDWLVLVGTIAAIVSWGLYKSRRINTVDAYLRGGSMKWYTIGLSIMATQASAITFLSMPGQAYEDGMGFVQFYFGLPVAMVILSAFIVPIYYRLKVYTAYEYLEGRFDLKTRQLTALLFLLQRGLAAGLSIYAPAIILSTVMGWSLNVTNLVIGLLVIVYTVSGGTRAVSQTQTLQMGVMLGGMALAFGFIYHSLPPQLSLGDAVGIAGAMGKMKVVDFSPRLDTRYTFWSGITGGLFVQLAYFGTDQSQVQRYLSGSSLTESRLGMMFNGLVKIPMQFLILFVGLMVFVFYQFQPAPLFFNEAELHKAQRSAEGPALAALDARHGEISKDKQRAIGEMIDRHGSDGERVAKDKLRELDTEDRKIRKEARTLISKAHPMAESNDADYIFISFVKKYFPSGLVGLLLAVIFCASMSACASALNALGSTTVIDFYKRSVKPVASDGHYLLAAKVFTVFWGAVAVAFAAFASLVDNLIQAVNILGSIFYGPTLGVFLVGFFIRHVRGTPIFCATLIGQTIVILVFAYSKIGFLWYNVIGCASVVGLSLLIDLILPRSTKGNGDSLGGVGAISPEAARP